MSSFFEFWLVFCWFIFKFKMKYILVTGGVISGVGKGIISSSIGVICQSLGLACTVIKIDPYINIDAGTFSPSEHGKIHCFHLEIWF